MSAPEKPKERSFPKIEFTDSEAGALDFPSSKSRSYSYFKPAKLRATMYEDVTVDVQPDPERHLSQGWVYGFGDGPWSVTPQDWTAAEIGQLACLPGSERRVEPDDLPQQLRGRPPGGAVPEERQAGTRLRQLELVVADVPGAQRGCLDARRKRFGTARFHLDSAVRSDQHDQYRRRRQCRAQDALCAGPGAVQPLPRRRVRRF